MKVFRYHQPLLIYIFMCEDKKINFFQKLFFLTLNIFLRIFLLNIFVTSFLYSDEKIKANNIAEALYGYFQVNAASFGLFIITTVTHNRKNVRLMIGKLQKIVDERQCRARPLLLPILNIIFLDIDPETRKYYKMAENNGNRLFLLATAFIIGGYFIMTATFGMIGAVTQQIKNGEINFHKLYTPYRTWYVSSFDIFVWKICQVLLQGIFSVG